MVVRHSDVAAEGIFLTCAGWLTAYLFMNVERQVTSATLCIIIQENDCLSALADGGHCHVLTDRMFPPHCNERKTKLTVIFPHLRVICLHDFT